MSEHYYDSNGNHIKLVWNSVRYAQVGKRNQLYPLGLTQRLRSSPTEWRIPEVAEPAVDKKHSNMIQKLIDSAQENKETGVDELSGEALQITKAALLKVIRIFFWRCIVPKYLTSD